MGNFQPLMVSRLFNRDRSGSMTPNARFGPGGADISVCLEVGREKCLPHHLPIMSLEDAAKRSWDVLIVGAGPAGAMAAYELAHRSLRVLLVDRSVFPRPKVCGCCLNGQALAILNARGLGSWLSQLGAVPLRHLLLAAGGHRALLALPAGAALSRQALDTTLVNAAVEKGAAFLPHTNATLGSVTRAAHEVILRSGRNQVLAKAAVVLAADGLAGSFSTKRSPVEVAPLECVVHRRFGLNPKRRPMPHSKDSRIGAAVIIERGPTVYEPGVIYMACGVGGYVGLVRLEDGGLNIAAAFDSQALRTAGHAGHLAASILHEAGLPPVPEMLQLSWKGTPRLTCHARRLAAERLFLLGDAASFVEPFTGEGIAWAFRSAIAVAPLTGRAVQSWQPDLEREWTEIYRREVERRQTICRLTAGLLRRPRLTTMVVQLLAFLPFLSSAVLRQLNSRHVLETGTPQ